jgi:3-deoxy-D-manno-octulosonate 8-phosphate phosphatase (KDO 8-P phosphatase)
MDEYGFNDLRLCIIDLDGCLTDGMYLVSENGGVSKNFYTRDFWGMQQLQENGVRVIIMTHCYDDVIFAKLEKMPLKAKIKLNVCRLDWDTTKEDFIKQIFLIDGQWKATDLHILKPGGIWDHDMHVYKAEQIAYFGDAENDLEAMKLCGFTGCPNDALPIIKENANFLADSNGGHGAVMEFAMYILEQRQIIR